MEKFIKASNIENNNNGNQKQSKFRSLLDNKKAVIIGLGALSVFGGLILFLGRDTTSVNIQSGVKKDEVQSIVLETVKPIYEKQSQLEKQNQELNENLKKLNEILTKQSESKIQEDISKNIQPPPLTIKDAENSQIPPIPPPPNMPPPQGDRPQQEKPVFNSVSVPPLQTKQEKQDGQTTLENLKKKTMKKTVYIPAGSIAEGKLLYGFVAPTDGMFPPVVVEFVKPIRTANDYFIPAEKCLITTSAQYDISQELAILGGMKSTMSCVLKSGKVIEIPVNIAVGEEKKGSMVVIGLTGQEKYLSGEDYAKIMSSTALSGVANATQQSLIQQSFTTSGNVYTAIQNRGLYAVLGGVNTGIQKFVDFMLRKYDKKVPSIVVQPKDHLFIVFVNGVDLGITQEEL